VSGRSRSLLMAALLAVCVPVVLSFSSEGEGVQTPFRFQLRLGETAAGEISDLGLDVPVV